MKAYVTPEQRKEALTAVLVKAGLKEVQEQIPGFAFTLTMKPELVIPTYELRKGATPTVFSFDHRMLILSHTQP